MRTLPLQINTNFMQKLQRLILIGFICSLPTSCGDASKRLVNDYRLECFPEGETYFVVDSKHDADMGGVFSGSIEKIGLNADWILARVRKNVSQPFKKNQEWYALHLKDGRIVGPISEQDLKNDSVWSAIKVQNPTIEFANLH